MRKLIPCLLLLLLLFLSPLACAETYVFDNIFASVEVPDSYIVLNDANLNTYADWLESRGTSTEEVANDFIKRGVLLQAWTAEYDVCFELTAVENERAKTIFNVNEQSTEVRGSYRLSHYPDNEFEQEGYEFSAADWKNTPSGRFLVMRYQKRDGSETAYSGLMRRTICNGHEITFDMQIHDRAVTNKDNSNLNRIWDSFQFIEVKPLPPSASAKIIIDEVPPTETNDQSFSIDGTAAEGVKLTAVVMGLSHPEPLISEVMVGANGKFKLPIKLPKEGVFLITITGEYQGEDVVEFAYPVTYQSTLLTVNLTTKIPEIITTSDLTLLGTSEPGATIQVFVNGEAAFTKKVTAAGRFKLELDTSAEGPYEVVLAFSKKQLADRRITLKFSRKWMETDMLKELKNQAIKPGYGNLVKKMKGYEGRVMGYRAYFVNITQSGDEWIAQMALTKKGDTYSGMILVTCKEKPSYAVGERVMMYGTCVGMSLGNAEEGQAEGTPAESYPCFELLLFVNLKQ
ncbi:MAG: hypothetical protein RSE58_00850 [Clostridia bacterium]